VLPLCVLLATVGAASAQPVEVVSESRGPGDRATRKPDRPVTISVDCTRGESVDRALKKMVSKQEAEAFIEIHGMCDESVVMRGLTNVTLFGRFRMTT
jgi:hypothetical protein